MASRQHQLICGLLVRKMATFGYADVVSFDGMIRDGYFKDYPLPPKIGRHRPDCISVNKKGKKAIGEAKTSEDLKSDRTYEEIFDFTTVCRNDTEYEHVFIGYPIEGELYFEQLYHRLPEPNKKYIVAMRYNSDLDDEDDDF